MSLRVEHLDAAEVATSGGLDTIDRLFAGGLDAVIVRELFPRAVIDAVAAKLGTATPTPLSDGNPIAFIGRPLQWAGADLSAYLAETARVDGALGSLFPGFLERVHQTLSRLAANRAVLVATGIDGARYVPATIRRMPPGSAVAPHFELGQLDFPGYASLGARIDRATLLSFYVPIVAAERGGELAAYSLRAGDPDAALINDDSTREPGPLLGRYPPTYLLPSEGDLLVFDSGRHLHGVTTIAGTRARWTIGGLIARSRDGATLLSWA